MRGLAEIKAQNDHWAERSIREGIESVQSLERAKAKLRETSERFLNYRATEAELKDAADCVGEASRALLKS